MKRAIVLGTLAAVGALACGEPDARVLPPYGQLVLYVDTDAPLPAPPGEALSATDAPALFHRLRIEIYRPGEATPCADCTHEFELDRRLVAEHRASIGITPPVGVTGFIARVRMFRAQSAELGEPRTDSTVESVVALPAIAAEGVTSVTVNLRTEDLAKPRGTREQPIAPELGTPHAGFSASWKSSRRIECAEKARPGEVCIPGGAFWMGNPLSRLIISEHSEPLIMRIANVSPFYLLDHEVTVGEFRKAALASDTDPALAPVEQGEVGEEVPCTFTKGFGNNEDFPVTCVSWERARAYCQALDADLPTEAQFQYAAGGLESRLYLWGDDPPTCEDAIYARAHLILDPFVTCPGAWVEVAGRGARDRLVRPGGVILDLAGNVSEHALDFWNRADEPCWGSGVFTNPVCETPTKITGIPAGARSIVGGNWLAPGAFTVSTTRGYGIPFALALQKRSTYATALSSVGFRCARPG
jgi:formylglycine-generating enzyme required for sulfatase activity